MTATDFIDQLKPLVPERRAGAARRRSTPTSPRRLRSRAAHIVAVCLALARHAGPRVRRVLDVTAADHHPRRDPRFDVVYHFVSPHRRARVRLKVQLAAGQPIADDHPGVAGRRLAASAKSTTCSASSSRATRTCAG